MTRSPTPSKSHPSRSEPHARRELSPIESRDRWVTPSPHCCSFCGKAAASPPSAPFHATRYYGSSGAPAAKHYCFRPRTSTPWPEDETTAPDDIRARRPGACRRPQPRAKASANRRPGRTPLDRPKRGRANPSPPGRPPGHARALRGRRAADARRHAIRLLDIGVLPDTSRPSSGICRGPASTPIPDSWPRRLAGDTHSLLGPIPARQPADDPAQQEPRLRREREIASHAGDDAERQAQHRSERDRGSDAHTRESMRGVAARGDLPAIGPLVLSVGGVGQS
jgi:hypothetical protein